MKEVLVCPYCDGNNFVEGKSVGEGGIMFSPFNRVDVIHKVCVECGSIVHSRVKQLERVRKKYDREQSNKNKEVLNFEIDDI